MTQLPTLEPKTYSSLSINQKSIVELSRDKDLYLFKLDNISHHQPSHESTPSKSELVASKYLAHSITPSSSPMSSLSSSNLSNRQPLACIGCRKQKLKCLGGKPCQRCDKRGELSLVGSLLSDKFFAGIECVYDTTIRRRGPDKVAGGRLKTIS